MQQYANNKTRYHQIIFLLCFLCYCFSPSYASPTVQGNEILTKTGSLETELHAPFSSTGETNSKKKVDSGSGTRVEEVLKCDQECKKQELIKIGVRDEIAISLVDNCKALADDPRKCVIAGASIVISESSGGYKCRKNNSYNCFGIMQNNDYKSFNDATLHFAGKFQKWWRNAKSASFFYPSRGSYSPSRFCVSEHSSNSIIGCPNGQKNAQSIWDKLEKVF